MGTLNVYPDFLRQVFNVLLAEHENIDERTASEAKKLVWEAENKYKFSSFDNPDPKESLKKYFESEDFLQLLKLLKNKEALVEELAKRVRTYYGDELASVVTKRLEELKKASP